ncbi:LEAF RUST 10 DISEASE-RESISTANCE LOCUS RECEPTOR-LIKE PROTEIN KINASE-like 2.7 isoform X2 [Salvia splendens]|uniref:LEAF RUST 10 DISEASE-RESISTANCE LOCUS RECEPTOR-LIKE PROTEIN KINASE-like 2.7 isoform X2 n=1 Tax=Salvia splendens TaxID=180675 RepID=UPI001C26CC00|nr:LEAF RUST 10 DISEASE-RESISTANCE LOCUS RECEPTOR-LIKE PROTEIN KINASE-like 2.7 isoform X2 [Salvia splendens]
MESNSDRFCTLFSTLYQLTLSPLCVFEIEMQTSLITHYFKLTIKSLRNRGSILCMLLFRNIWHSEPSKLPAMSTTLLLLFILTTLAHFPHANPHCPPSSCGVIRNISYPFRLKSDSSHCGHRILTCHHNLTSIFLDSRNYYVKAIDYQNSTIRLVDASLNYDNICSFPISTVHYRYFSNDSDYSYYIPINYNSTYRYDYKATPINLMSCPNPMKNSSLYTNISTKCSRMNDRPYLYIKVGRMRASEVQDLCRLDHIAMTSWEFHDLKNVSLSEIHHSLLYGFELTFCNDCGPWPSPFWWDLLLHPIALLIIGLLCAMVGPPIFTIFGIGPVSLGLYQTLSFFGDRIISPLVAGDDVFPSAQECIEFVIELIIMLPRVILFPVAMWLLIKKFRRRHRSMYARIESFLRSDNQLTPIRYSYSDIKKMTGGFQDKLGEGGYGSVYKGKLRSGFHVTVKLLGKSGGSGQDFMNEIATIGRIHHVNVVKLVGYCAHGSKRALIYDFMPNGSLEKYLFNRDKTISLSWDTKFEIAVGVARGIEYLHRGCDVQILHFDIKPHNILLDDNFIPKISDFGLAKFFSTGKTTVTMTAARGTIGYVAPELISRSIGAVSYKADVYSFGMLLMEMVSLKKDLIGNNDDSSQYFPYWIYDYFNLGKDIEVVNGGDDASWRKFGRKMTIVALWCIQMCPDHRPSMNKVLEMLEGDVDRLNIPEYPSQSIQTAVDQTCSTDSVPLLEHDDASPSVEIIVEELQSLS